MKPQKTLVLALAMMGVFVASGDEVATYSQRLTRPLLPKTQKFSVQDAVFAAFDAADRAADAAKFKPPYRAYIVPCGHTWEGKGSPGYQRGGVMGALAGFAAFVYEPFAQGERMQPPAGGCCDGHNHYGALAELLGTSAARQSIWDGMRALDYLESRADIRPNLR